MFSAFAIADCSVFLTSGRVPDYTEIRDRLVLDYNRMRSERAKDTLYEGLATEYDIEIDDEAVQRAALVPGGVLQDGGSP